LLLRENFYRDRLDPDNIKSLNCLIMLQMIRLYQSSG